PGGHGPGGPGFGPPGAGAGATVGTARAQEGDIPVLIEALGTVTPPVTATLVPQVSGVLTEVLFEEGQSVKKGQVLARIDVRPYEQSLAQARGQRAKDEAQLAAARVTLTRYQTLLAQDSIARQDVDTQAALVKQLEGVVEAGRASERAAELNVGFASIRAPISGRIGLRTVDPGNLVSSGSATGIATITQMAPIDVLFSVPQERVQAVLAAQRSGPLTVRALDRERSRTLAEGRFLTLDNQINTATGTVRAKARFANADGALFPNQFVNARLQLGRERGVLVPVTAVRTGPQGDYVYVVDDERVARMRPVVRGIATTDQMLLREGLQPGERVVTEGGDRVKDGGRVQVAGGAAGAGAEGRAGAAARAP
ncbi:efflux RND transporter periplasmic adaptor subunit, partial [Melaminivora sp.]|uniref:efflux RND transporter periplasmic adaptor subunit n=1 Tax=Melaminivora sp. TaxID=1933032 RepID=UPI0028B0A465